MIYKSGLFLTAGAVEKQTGTTDLKKLGGLGSKMPVTFGCFIIAAISISGYRHSTDSFQRINIRWCT